MRAASRGSGADWGGQCLGQNYALNEASYFLVRLLQQFDGFELALEAQPEASRPPEEWKTREGRQAYEQVWPEAAMTLFIKVSRRTRNPYYNSAHPFAGRVVGAVS